MLILSLNHLMRNFKDIERIKIIKVFFLSVMNEPLLRFHEILSFGVYDEDLEF
jgi:hypothetical protein